MDPRAPLLVGNLDAECDFARALDARAPRQTLPHRVLRVLSGLSTLMRALARDGDELRTLLPVAPERLADVPGLPRPRLTAGPLASFGGRPEVLAWAETPAVARARAPEPPKALPAGAPLHEVLWRLPRPTPQAVAGVSDRAFGLEVARELGCALPGARMVASPDELAAHLRGVDVHSWVVKAPYSAAGRWRHVQHGGGGELAPQARRTLERLIARHGPLLFEPWMERTADFGLAALLTPEDTRLVGFHRLLVDRQGRFKGLELRAAFAGFEGLSAEEQQRLGETLEGVSRALRRAGYLGPFGIDGWRCRRRDGGLAFHPLGEINARMTFGQVARALVDRVAGPLGLANADRVRLVVGKGDPIVPLLLPDRDGSAAWLEVRRVEGAALRAPILLPPDAEGSIGFNGPPA